MTMGRWMQQLQRNAIEAAQAEAKRPPRTEPLVPRDRRILGWFSDSALAALKVKLDATVLNCKNRKEIERRLLQIENELAERKLDPRKEA